MVPAEIISIFCRRHYLSYSHFLKLLEVASIVSSPAHLYREVEDFSLAEFLQKNESSWKICDKILERLHQIEAQIIFPGAKDYPRSFLELEKPPVFLSYWGKPIWQSQECLSVVGSRRAQDCSIQWLESHLSHFLNESPCTVVSGGAFGIDQRAHGVALKRNSPTVVLLPSGLSNLYPSELSRWLEPVLTGGGAFVSEYFPGIEVRRLHFHERNRMVAAFAKVLLVIEAGRRSGTMISARYAVDLGKELAVVPGHPLWSSFSGSLSLIKQGGHLIEDSGDLQSLWQLSR